MGQRINFGGAEWELEDDSWSSPVPDSVKSAQFNFRKVERKRSVEQYEDFSEYLDSGIGRPISVHWIRCLLDYFADYLEARILEKLGRE